MDEIDRKPLFTDSEVREFFVKLGTLSNIYTSAEWEKNYLLLLGLRSRIESRCRNNSLEELWKETVPWSNKTFPQATVQSIANHILSEAKELATRPYDGMEVADIALLLGHLVSRLNISLVEFARQKFEINKKRVWGHVNSEGFVEHVKKEGGEENPQATRRPTIEVDALWHERVFEVSNGKETGRMGTIIFYTRGGKRYAQPIIWDDELQAT